MSKTQKVLSHLKKYKSITPKDAYELYGSMRLSGIIYNLKENYNIFTEIEENTDKFKNKVRYARYKYKGKIKGE
tara:strand:- start:3882 stop:4103 length:222 start_codon:yes stop_codon:yes gene_type:complete